MTIGLELYLLDRAMRGELRDAGDRPLDRLNSPLSNLLILDNAQVQSLHTGAVLATAHAVRVYKEHILLAVPRDSTPVGAAQLRGIWLKKAAVRVTLGVGPFTVTGRLHPSSVDQTAVDRLLRPGAGPAFLPVTAALIQVLYRPDWSVEVATVLVARAALSDVSLLDSPEELTDQPQVSADQLFHRFGPYSVAEPSRRPGYPRS